MLQNLQDDKIPYFNFNYYLIIVAHCANAMSAIARYVNILVPLSESSIYFNILNLADVDLKSSLTPCVYYPF